MHTARFRYESFGHNGTEGFRDELTAGGQGVGVYMHVLGNAGAKLLNPLIGNPIIGGNHIKDKIQTWLGTNRGEGPAELAGNQAGARVGQHMWNYISGATPQVEQRLRNSLLSELCK